jgi:ubiquinone/menaquinone biosynthesis C-methylase UbiE
MPTASDESFWSDLASSYDGHVASREAVALFPRIAALLEKRSCVLDLGCGTGELALMLASTVDRVHGVDYAEGMIAQALGKAAERGADNVEFSVHGADALPFADHTFDAVVMANVLHVMEHPERALGEVARVIRPQGLLVAPTYCHGQNLRARLVSRLSVLLFGIRVHNRWRAEQVLDLTTNAGFSIQEHAMVPFRMPLVFVVASMS